MVLCINLQVFELWSHKLKQFCSLIHSPHYKNSLMEELTTLAELSGPFRHLVEESLLRIEQPNVTLNFDILLVISSK